MLRAGCLLAIVVLGGAPTGLASEPDDVASVLLGEASDAARRKASLDSARQKVDAVIGRLAWHEPTRRSRLSGLPSALPETSWRRAGRVHVVIEIAGTAAAAVEALRSAGLEIEVVNDRFALVQGWVADDALPILARVAAVRRISPAWPAERSAGAVTSEGDAAARADLVRRSGHDGRGVVLGAISDGIDSLAASQASGDLPAVGVPVDPRCRRGSGHEGTAMLEIVHDLAPGAARPFSGPRRARR